MKIISNIYDSHTEWLKSLFVDSDKIVIVSPFLLTDFEDSPLNTEELAVKEITLYTVLKSNDYDSLVRIEALNSFMEFCIKRNIKYSVRIDKHLHAKIYLSYKNKSLKKAILSSANYTDNGLYKNHELGVFIEDAVLLQSIEEQINNLPYDIISEDSIKKLYKQLKEFDDDKKQFEKPKFNFDLDSFLEKTKNNKNIPETKYFLKPIGSQEKPFLLDRVLAEDFERQYFSKRYPRAVIPGSILICYAVGDGRLIGYYEVVSDVKTDDEEARWPYYVDSKTLNKEYSRNWTRHKLYASRLASDYNGLAITYIGSKTLGALNRGSDKIRLNEDFAQFLICKIDATSQNVTTTGIPNLQVQNANNSSSAHLQSMSSYFGDYEKIIAREIIAAAVKQRIIYYGDLFKKTNYYYYDDITIGPPLGKISELCIKLGLPLLSSIVINKTTGKPGIGFQVFNKEGKDEVEFFFEESKKVYEHIDWKALEPYLK